MRKRQLWAGGYIRKTKAGRTTYIIERWAKGRRVHVSTGCVTREAALKELTRFELDPLRYSPGGAHPEGVFLTAQLALAYREHMLKKGLSVEWAYEVVRCLADWEEAVRGFDLRTLHLHRDLKRALATWPTQQAARIKSIKGFMRWLREEKGLIERSQDAALDLKVPQARPEKQKRRKVVPPEDVAAVLEHLVQPTRDILHLLTATGWHLSEVRRFALGGEIVTPMNSHGVLAVLVTRHKSGDLTKTPILYPEHLEAAHRIRALKRFPTRMTVARHMKAARVAAKVPYFGAGQMRHSVITWAVGDGGASVADVKEFAHHRSESTTKRFYLDLDIPKAAVPIYRLT